MRLIDKKKYKKYQSNLSTVLTLIFEGLVRLIFFSKQEIQNMLFWPLLKTTSKLFWNVYENTQHLRPLSFHLSEADKCSSTSYSDSFTVLIEGGGLAQLVQCPLWSRRLEVRNTTWTGIFCVQNNYLGTGFHNFNFLLRWRLPTYVSYEIDQTRSSDTFHMRWIAFLS
jgi:hypothetical protein